MYAIITNILASEIQFSLINELHFVSGSLKLMVRSSLLTSDQVTRGMDDLIGVLEEQYELESTVSVDGSDDDDDSITCGLLPPKKTNKARMHAEEEVSLLFREYRKSEQLPVFKRTANTKYLHGTESNTISDHMIIIGDEIEQRGAYLPSGKNYADYFKFGKFQHIQFWLHHQKQFPKLWMYALRIASANPTEVSCESLFSQSGYASTSRNTRMKSVNFERETIIANNLQNVYFDIERAVDTYMKRENNKEWGDDDDCRDAMFYLDQE